MLAAAAALSPEVLSKRPEPEAWSVLEIVEHLVMAEEGVLGELSTFGERTARRRTLKHRILYGIVFFVLRFRVDVRVPSPSMLPTGGHTLGDLQGRWEERHGQLRSLLSGLDGAGERRAVVRHPVAGPMGLAQAMRLLETHIDRHSGQIDAVTRRLAHPD